MNDEQFLSWLRDRLVNVYNESPNVDFVLRLEKIIKRESARQKLTEALKEFS